MTTPSPPSPSALPVRLVVGVTALVLAIAVVLAVVLVGGGDDDEAGPITSTPGASSNGSADAEPSELEAADAQFPGLVVENDLSRNHANRGERIAYPELDAHPPLGGNHAAIWMKCQAYSAPVPTENAVHSLEHGAVWITYQSNLGDEDVRALAARADRDDAKVLVSPRDDQDTTVVLTAWGRQLRMNVLDLTVVQRFVDTYDDGPQNPEPGVSCDSPVDRPGDAPFLYTGSDVQVSTSTETVPAEGSIS